MALTPINYVVIDAEMADEITSTRSRPAPSYTINLDLEGGRLGSHIDGNQAIQQFIRKAISTARSHFLIYDDEYGCEIDELIRHSLPFNVLEVEIPRLIIDALIYDDRIEAVSNFKLTKLTDGIHVSFTVTLVDGYLLDSEVII